MSDFFNDGRSTDCCDFGVLMREGEVRVLLLHHLGCSLEIYKSCSWNPAKSIEWSIKKEDSKSNIVCVWRIVLSLQCTHGLPVSRMGWLGLSFLTVYKNAHFPNHHKNVYLSSIKNFAILAKIQRQIFLCYFDFKSWKVFSLNSCSFQQASLPLLGLTRDLWTEDWSPFLPSPQNKALGQM